MIIVSSAVRRVLTVRASIRVNRDIKEQSNDIYKVSISGGGLKAEVVTWCEVVE